MSAAPLPTTLADWLAWIERLHPKTIELGLDRLRTVAQRLGLQLDCTVITVAGTNGKGSTCAMLESILLQAGYRVALYTSPHLVHFNERARVDGVPATDEQLLPHFEAVERARGDEQLTYFEFTTLAILRLFAAQAPDVAILEVGLGGRLDAVNLVDADCAIVTSIDIDHTEFLGDTREAIGLEKAHVFRAGRPAICSDPLPPASLVAHAQAIGADLWLFGRDFNYAGDRQQWSYGGRQQRRNSLAFPALRGANQLLNASGVLAALEALRNRLPVPQQAVRQGLSAVELPGRFQVLPGRPVVVLDVAHNPHAAAHLASNLDGMGLTRRTWGVFGAMADKDIEAIVEHLKTRIDHWLLVDLPGARAATAQMLQERLAAAGVRSGDPLLRGGTSIPPVSTQGNAVEASVRIVETHSTPREALAAAQARAGQDDRIVAFGSFLTVADVLEARQRRA